MQPFLSARLQRPILSGNPFLPCVLALSLSIQLNSAPFQFDGAVDYEVSLYPYALAVADANGDLRLDLVTANFGSDSIGVLLANEEGTFSAPVLYPVGHRPYFVVAADLDGDELPDLVTANSQDNSISILLGRGEGTFGSPLNLAVGASPRCVAVADFNDDTELDLVVANALADSVSILLGSGDGHFTLTGSQVVGSYPTFVAAADLNHDDETDIVTANYLGNDVSVLLGRGTGGFAQPVHYATGNNPSSLALGDLNGDGKLDLVSANYGNDSVSVRFGNGDGTFAQRADLAVGHYPVSVSLQDMNSDGRLDMVVANNGAKSVSILLGNGDGTFGSLAKVSVGHFPSFVVTGLLNGDGKVDIATANASANSVSVLRQLRFPPVLAEIPDQMIAEWSSLALAAVATDPEVPASELTFSLLSAPPGLTINPTSGLIRWTTTEEQGPTTNLVILRVSDSRVPSSSATQSFQVVVSEVNEAPTLSAIPDQSAVPYSTLAFTPRATDPDVPANKLTYALLSAPEGAAVNPTNGLVTWTPNRNQAASTNLVLMLVRDDGYPSLSDTNLFTVTVSDLPALAFRAVTNDLFVRNALLGDFDADGRADLISWHGDSSVLSFFSGHGDGTFGKEIATSLSRFPATVAAGGLNSDKFLDLVVGNSDASTTALLGHGDGTFVQRAGPSLESRPASLITGDVNRDGYADVISANASSNSVSVLLGQGDGGLVLSTNIHFEDLLRLLAVLDCNADGKPDILAVNSQSNTVNVLLGGGDGTFAAMKESALSHHDSVAEGDFNGDGFPDLAAVSDYNDSIAIVLGNGDGTFGEEASFDAGCEILSVATGDFDGDAVADIVTVDNCDSRLLVLPGNGDGTFSAPIAFPVGINPSSVAVGDFDGDRKPDLLVASANGERFIVFLNATLWNAAPPAVGTSPPTEVAAASAVLNGTVNPNGLTALAFFEWGTNAAYGNVTPAAPFYSGREIVPMSAVVMGLVPGETYHHRLVASNRLGIVYGGDQLWLAHEPGGNLALSLNGRDNYVEVPTQLSNEFDESDPFTVMLWFRANRLHDGGLVCKTPENAGQLGLLTEVTAAGTISFALGGIGVQGASRITSEPVYASNQWFHVAFVRSNAGESRRMQIYFNGRLVADGPFGADATAALGRVTIGANLTGGAGTYFDGQIDDVSFWDSALTPAQIRDRLARTLSGNESGLVGYYPFDEGRGTTALDNSRSLNHGALVGSPLWSLSTVPLGALVPAIAIQPQSQTVEQGETVTFSVSATGLAPLSYQWQRDGLPVSGATSPQLMIFGTADAEAGGYTVVVGNVLGETESQEALLTVNSLVGFATGRERTVDPWPGALAAADFNRDRKTDVVAANSASNCLVVLLGQGDGDFAEAVCFSLPASPLAVAAGDLNLDGKPDLASANADGSISILLGDGSGGFESPVQYQVGAGPRSLVIADFNGDRKPDLASANSAANTVSILPGNGDGSFGAATSHHVGQAPFCIAVGDFNGDRRPDLVTANHESDSITVLLLDEGGLVKESTEYPAGAAPSSVIVADLNGDSKADLLIANEEGNSMSVVLGNGDGTFRAAVDYAVGFRPQAVAAGDCDGDGRMDVITANSNGSIAFLAGKGDGTLETAKSRKVAAACVSVLLPDLNGDAKPDIVTQDGGERAAVIVLLNSFEASAPALRIGLEENHAVLSWRTFGAGFFELEATADPAEPAWSLVQDLPSTVGDRNVLIREITGDRQFYRLRNRR